MHAIEVTQLHKHFGPLHAVNNISFTVNRGDVLGFLGPNGAGKSTTMKMIAGFLEPSSGTIRVAGHDVAQEPLQAKAKFGYLPEGAPLYGEMTPAGFLDFIAEVRGLTGDVKDARIRDAIAKIHLDAVVDQRIETLSKGFKRRVGLAQAILHDPEVLILDEPTDGLDPNQKHEVRTLIQNMARDKAIIISTHILEEVDAVCTKAIIIANGKLLFSGTPQELAQRSPQFNAVSMTLSDTLAPTVKQRIANLPNIAKVETSSAGNGVTRILALPKSNMSILSSIADLVRSERWEIGELHVDSGRLDEVFRVITTQGRRQ